MVTSKFNFPVKLLPVVSLSLPVGLAMFLAITASAVIGGAVPAFFKKIHIDPALASGPIVATVIDVAGIVIYMAIATAFLRFLV